MTDVVIPSDRADAETAERIVEHHAELAGRLTALVRTSSRAGSAKEVGEARDRMVAWARTSLLPTRQPRSGPSTRRPPNSPS